MGARSPRWLAGFEKITTSIGILICRPALIKIRLSSLLGGLPAPFWRRTLRRMTSGQTVARIVIDDAFIREWHPKYDLTENDESEYQRLVAEVARDLK